MAVAVPLNGRSRSATPATARRARLQVLLADDSETVRGITSALLRRLDCNVDAVEHGEQALRLARHVRYDLILLDLDMPLLDGIDTAREIRALPSAGRTPIMAVSAFLDGIGDPEERRQLFDAEIAKPVSAEQLRRIVLEAWPMGSLQKPEPQDRDGHLPLVDPAILSITRMSVGSGAMSGVIDKAVFAMRTFAGQLELAAGRDDRAPLRRAAYDLRRIALGVGAARLARRATLLMAAAGILPVGELRSQTVQLLGLLAATIDELEEVVAKRPH